MNRKIPGETHRKSNQNREQRSEMHTRSNMCVLFIPDKDRERVEMVLNVLST